jgi:hypothetical protein
VWIAYDEDTDTIYVYRTYRQAQAVITVHAQQLLGQGRWIPVAWPHDGWVHDKQSGKSIKDLYIEAGCTMLPTHATFGDDKDKQNYGFETGIEAMLDRMQTGRWKVFSTCEEWWQEFPGYHRLDGKVVKRDDDTISAARIGMMMLRHGKTLAEAAMEGEVKQGITDFRMPAFGVLDPVTGY